MQIRFLRSAIAAVALSLTLAACGKPDQAPPVTDPAQTLPTEQPAPVPAEQPAPAEPAPTPARSEEHTSELQSLMRISYAVFCLKKKKKNVPNTKTTQRINNIQ